MAIENIEQGTLPAHIKAVIALTSWKKRINTVGLTIFNLRCVCGRDFHIVLTLAEEEFPGKEQELPEDLMRMNRAGIFEILWVKKNYKSFKKWVFAAERYSNMPIISADDDCLYYCNYAQELYNTWISHKYSIITNNGMPKEQYGITWGRGPNTLYPPKFGHRLLKQVYSRTLMKVMHSMQAFEDDSLYGCAAQKYGIAYIDIQKPSFYIFHDMRNPLSEISTIDFATLIDLYNHFIVF